MFDLQNVNGYFESHLQRELWAGVPDDERRTAIAMAERDVAARLGLDEVSGTDVFQYCAVCEQALFLTQALGSATRQTVLVEESIEGVGSRKYQLPPTPGGAWSSRALTFLSRAPANAVPAPSPIAPIRTSRG